MQLMPAVFVSSARTIAEGCLAGKRWVEVWYQRGWSSNLRFHFPQDYVESFHHAFCIPTGMSSLGLAWRGVGALGWEANVASCGRDVPSPSEDVASLYDSGMWNVSHRFSPNDTNFSRS